MVHTLKSVTSTVLYGEVLKCDAVPDSAGVPTFVRCAEGSLNVL